MSGSQIPHPDPMRARRGRPRGRSVLWSRAGARVLRLALLLGLLVTQAVTQVARGADAGSAAPVAIRIAVAPFVGEEGGEAIGELLSVRVGRLGVERLLAPGTFVAEREFDPSAAVVRTWADRAAVDSIVVGRVVPLRARSEARQVEAVVRSGHSGAELFRHAVLVPARAGLGSALDQLATAIVRDLGGDPSKAIVEPTTPAPPPVSAGASEPVAAPASKSDPSTNPPKAAAEPKPAAKGEAAKSQGEKSQAAKGDGEKGVRASGGLETRIGVAKFRTDAPIEIKADQAEITAEGDDRKLVFQGGVWVKQDNVVVTSEHLEAEYVDGESEPSRLLAKGSVHVEQGNRAASCDRAEYLRATAQLTCRGHAELVQGCDVVRGEVIVLDLGADKARVEGAASIVINPRQNSDPRCATPGGRP